MKKKTIAEGSSANLFIIKDNKVITPPLTDGCVNGVMRKQLQNIVTSSGFHVIEKSLTYDEIIEAEEIFLSNTITGIKAVTTLEGKKFNTVKTQMIMQHFIASIDQF